MDAASCVEQARILRLAAESSPMALYAGRLRGEASELAEVARALKEAEDDGIKGAEVVPVAVLAKGVHVYWPNTGRGRVQRVTVDFTGIQLEWERWAELAMDRPVGWINVMGGHTPVVVVP